MREMLGVLGALVVNAGKSDFAAAAPGYWLFALGGLFVLVTLFLPRGLVGTREPSAFLHRRKAVSGAFVGQGHG